MKTILFAAVLTMLSGAASAGTMTLGSGVVGCQSLETMQRWTSLVNRGDGTAANRLISTSYPAYCAILKGQVELESYSTEGRLYCLRPMGDPACYWVPRDYVDGSNIAG